MHRVVPEKPMAKRVQIKRSVSLFGFKQAISSPIAEQKASSL